MFNEETILRLIMALLAGAALGLEREVQRKAAGIRTLTLISLSSALFTIIGSYIHGTTGDRIASNILTGVGFIGAGVIFRGGFTIDGITTAATIWLSAAVGMAMGTGEFALGWTAAVFALAVLWGFTLIEAQIAARRDRKYYAIRYRESDMREEQLEALFREQGVTSKKISTSKDLDQHTGVVTLEGKYELTGTAQRMERLNDLLLANRSILHFDVEVVK
ncbi:MgtC/SapB family protein [Chitinophaga lutea]